MGTNNQSVSMDTKIEVLVKFETGEYTKAALGRLYGVSPRSIGRWIDAANEYLTSYDNAEPVEVPPQAAYDAPEEDVMLPIEGETPVEQEESETSKQNSTVANYQLSKGFINVILSDGSTKTADSSHEHFAEMVQLLLTNDQEEMNKVVELIDVKHKLINTNIAGLEIVNSQITYQGERINSSIAAILIHRIEMGDQPLHLAAFIKRAVKNPSKVSMDTLFDFLAYNNIMINRSGMVLGWKFVNTDYRDNYTNSIDNSVGSVVEMERDKVDPNPDNTCSSGLHVGSIEYVARSANYNRIVLVSLDPADAVVVPTDYNGQKLRSCRYTVIADVTDYVKEYNAGTTSLEELLAEINIDAEPLKGES